jgi:hypothetical protein
MTVEELSLILRDRYHNAADRKVALSVHLYGIEFAKALRGHSIEEICARADVPKSYSTEIRKGIRLSDFVVLK